MMQWEKLLSLQKFGDTKIRERKNEKPTRIAFDVDYDRIIFSESFRSLQDKTQVIPLSKSGFVHTRLTHSMEVSVVGRSLGRLVGSDLLSKYPNLGEMGYQANDFGAIVASACLAHDIGNPPFGHSGEKAISEFFQQKKQDLSPYLSAEEMEDLCHFEGNANGFRILTQSSGALSLSFATLGTFIKYPKEVLPVKPSQRIAQKKYNVFQSEKPFFKELATALGLRSYSEKWLSYARHPLAFLVEAADDICYTIIDFEDGTNLGIIPENEALEYLLPIIGNPPEGKEKFLQKYENLPTKANRISYLRALAIGSLIEDAKKTFLQYEKEILQGDFHFSLLEKGNFSEQTQAIISLSAEKIYRSPQVLEKELSGYAILQNLLKAYYGAVIRQREGKLTSYDALLLRTLAKNYLHPKGSLYESVMGVACYVASLTDTQATEMHARLLGIIKN